MLKGSSVPELRTQSVNEASCQESRDYVLYWMIANRRHDHNFALQRAVEWAKELGKPLLVLEALRVGYRWASDRIHQFVIDGMSDNAQRFVERKTTYVAYVERESGEGSGLLEALAKDAAVVVTDEFPCFFLPRMVSAVAARVDVLMETVDSNGLLPLRAAEKDFARAFDFRRFLQRTLPDHILDFPKVDPLRGVELPAATVPAAVSKRWALLDADGLSSLDLSTLPIDHEVTPAELKGGTKAAGAQLTRFVRDRLPGYADNRNAVHEPTASGLSPYLHFGHMSAHRVFREIAHAEDWSPNTLKPSSGGKREGWWQMSANAEAFLDELITWREVGLNKCHIAPDYAEFDSLPPWVLENFRATASDPREYVYSLEEFEQARTHDEIWNAAQRELVQTGSMHNYLRMLWGKKILEWTATPRDALAIMIELNNKFALDGRNPNSYSGIFWVLGRYDRPWGPIRKIFGKVRYMSSDSTRKKLKLGPYLERFGDQSQSSLPGLG